MKKVLKLSTLAFVAIMVCALVAFSAVFAAGGNLSDKYADDDKVKEFQKTIDALENERKAIEAELDEIQEELKKSKNQLSEIGTLIKTNGELRDATAKIIDEYEKQVEEKQAEIDVIRAEIKAAEDDMALTKKKFLTLIRVQYENGAPSMLEAMYDANGIADMLSRMDQVGSIMEYNNNLLEHYTLEKQALDEKHTVLEGEKLEKEAVLSEKQAYNEELIGIEENLKEQQAEEKALYASISAEEQAVHDEYDRLSAEEEAESKRLEAYLKELAEKNKKAYAGGILDWPVDTSIKRISSWYGWRTYTYKGRQITDFHQGIDIPAPVGTDIYAVNDGEVVLSAKHSSYGEYIIVDHGGGISTLYAHCSKRLVQKGDTVKRGDHIAEMGSTGQSTGPHLHFEVRVNGKHEDPISNGWIIQPK